MVCVSLDADDIKKALFTTRALELLANKGELGAKDIKEFIDYSYEEIKKGETNEKLVKVLKKFI